MFYVSVVSDCFINSAAYVSSMIYLLLPPPPPCVALSKSFILPGRRTGELVGGGGRDLRDHQSRPFTLSIRITATTQTIPKLVVDQYTRGPQ